MAEKSINELPRNLKELYDKGMGAIQRHNWDYAIALFMQVLAQEPSCYDCREALRATQFKKAGASGGFFKRMLGTASSSPLVAKGQIVLRSNPLEAMAIAEQILNSDPHSVSAHKILAEAAMQTGMPKTAVLSLELALKAAPKDKDVAIRLGEALAEAGQIGRAENIYAELQRAHPQDQAISQLLKNISAKRTMHEGGYQGLESGAGSYRDILKDKNQSVLLEQEGRQHKSAEVIHRLLEDAETRLQSEPHNLNLLRSTAELHAQLNDLPRALEYYQRIMQTEGATDPTLEAAITQLKLKQFDQALAALDPNSPDYPEQSTRIQSEKQTFRLTDLQRRSEKYPNDLQTRFELGEAYFQVGKLTEAIQEFQRAQNNPHIRTKAQGYLGKCFARRGMLDLAARTFQNALKEKPVLDEEKKDLIYNLGLVLEKMDKPDEAIEQFKQIYEVDIRYKDVAAKVDAYYSSRS
jgi:tetratricopeptide (TPR) repeat protein